MIKKILWITICILVAVLITFFSTQGAEESNALSRSIVDPIVELAEKIIGRELPENSAAVNNNRIRDLAHFFMFMLLGLAAYAALKEVGVHRSFLWAMVFCGIYALFDEVLQQMLGQGRAFELVDLLKDWGGSLTGMLFMGAFYWKKSRTIMR